MARWRCMGQPCRLLDLPARNLAVACRSRRMALARPSGESTPDSQSAQQLVSLAGTHFRGEFLQNIRRIQFVDRGQPIRVTSHVIDRELNRVHLDIAASWPDRDFRLQVLPASMVARLKDLLGMQDVSVGDTRFDREYEISSNMARPVRRDTRPVVAESLESLRRHNGGFRLLIAGGQFAICAATAMTRPALLDTIQRVLAIYHRALEDFQTRERLRTLATTSPTPSSTGHRDARSTTAATPAPMVIDTEGSLDITLQVICQICGEAILGEHVECRHCRTPHHEECWHYLGGCSTYACGNDTYRQRPSLR